MGGSVIVFDKDSGANFVKGRKRMRGQPNSGPEIKKWNCISNTNSYTSYDFVNNITSGTGVYTNFSPVRLQWPPVGDVTGQRVGSRINFLGLRIKGWITLAANQLKQIRWRLVLARWDQAFDTGQLYNAPAYLKQFCNSDSNVPQAFDVSRYESYCRHNFYKKFKDVANKSFKTKVLASGVLPATTTYSKMTLNLTGTVSGSAATLNSNSLTPSYVLGMHSGNIGYLPFDVKVRINDNVDCQQDLRRYFLVLECDCGYGWADDGAATSGSPGMILNIYTRGYYTDA